MSRKFPGGRRWPSKGFIYHKKFETVARPPELAVPLWQGGRASVKPGDKVNAFDVIGHDREGLPVHAPLGGKVRGVGDFPHLLARPHKLDFPRLTVFIDVDRRQTADPPPYRPLPRFWELTHQELCQRLLEAGVMDVCHQDLPRMVIYDALDLEPPLSANRQLLEERTVQLLEGMAVLNQLHNAIRSRLVISPGQSGLEARLRALLASSVNLSLHLADRAYPQGHHHLLRQEVFPEDRCAIYGMAQVMRTQEAVVQGRPVVDSHLTAWNMPARTQRNLVVPIGTPAGHALWSDELESKAWRAASPTDRDESAAVGPDRDSDMTLVFGGLLSGRSYYSLEMPVQPDTRGLLLLRQSRPEPSACLNCGACHKLCPVGLHPSEIHLRTARLEVRRLRELGLERCLDCGLCSWSCPSKIELMQQIAVGKMLIEGKL